MAASQLARPRAVERGSTLIEVMAAMVIMLVGAAGIAGLNKMGLRLDGDGRRITRATAIAEDMLEQMALWPYNDPRLGNLNGGNDNNIGDAGFLMERQDDVSGEVDHAEDDLTANGRIWNGIPKATVEAGGFERYWSVSFKDPATGLDLDQNGNGVPDGMRIAVIVRYRNEAGWRRVVLLTTRISPQANR